mgnify:CR=1 FL=1
MSYKAEFNNRGMFGYAWESNQLRYATAAEAQANLEAMTWLLIVMLTTGQAVALDVESKERCEEMRAAVNDGTGSVSLKINGSLLRVPIAPQGGLMCITEAEFEAKKGAGA